MGKMAANVHAWERAVPGNSEWLLSHADHLNRYQYAVSFAKGKRVLDVGCGPGYGSALLRASGADDVVGVDVCLETLALARDRYAVPGLRFEEADAESLAGVGEGFDVICSFENIEHLKRPDLFVVSAARAISRDGTLLCSTTDRTFSNPSWQNGRPSNPYHVTEWYAEEFHHILAEGFLSVKMLSQVWTHSYIARAQARETLEFMWWNPAVRLGRLVERVFGRKRTPELANLLAPTLAEAPIVPSALASVYGTAISHFAICSGPREPRR